LIDRSLLVPCHASALSCSASDFPVLPAHVTDVNVITDVLFSRAFRLDVLQCEINTQGHAGFSFQRPVQRTVPGVPSSRAKIELVRHLSSELMIEEMAAISVVGCVFTKYTWLV
jgi:hypothetical protein